jgi:hypothetical protein
MPTHPEVKSETGLYIVRLYDMFDGWIDLSTPVDWETALVLWERSTRNGTKNTKYDDGDYYRIFPSDTRMLHTPEYRGR